MADDNSGLDPHQRWLREQAAAAHAMRQAQMPQPVKPWLTIYLLAILAIIYLLTGLVSALLDGHWSRLPGLLASPSQEVLADFGSGGLIPVMQGKYWVLITAGYLHLNLMHIAANSVSLLSITPLLERTLGPRRTFIIFAISGVTCGIGSVLMGEWYSLGASGSVFGFLGAVILVGWRMGGRTGRVLMNNGLFWAALNFGLGFSGVLAVSNGGHAGGFIGGLLTTMLMIYGPAMSRLSERMVAVICVVLTVAALAVGLGSGLSSAWRGVNNPEAYAQRLQERRSEDVNAMLARNPDDVDARLERAGLRFNQRDWQGAVEDFSKVLAQQPQNLIVQYYRGIARVYSGDPGSAAEDFQQIIQAPAVTAADHVAQGNVFNDRAQAPDARRSFEQALRLDPLNAAAREELKQLDQAASQSGGVTE